MILWNPETDTCYLEAYLQLELVTENPRCHAIWNPARFEANILRKASMGFFNVPMSRQVRCLSHEVWSKQSHSMSEYFCDVVNDIHVYTYTYNFGYYLVPNNNFTYNYLDPPLQEIRDEDNMITILRNRIDDVEEDDIMVYLRFRQPPI